MQTPTPPSRGRPQEEYVKQRPSLFTLALCESQDLGGNWQPLGKVIARRIARLRPREDRQ